MRLVPFLYATNFLTGATVMVIELLGTRFLAPYFGSNLYTWTALITVTLVALAAGYRLGGHLADRIPRASLLFTLLYVAGLFLLLVLLIRRPILASSAAAGIEGGTLISATALFGPPLFLLGMVSPFSVKFCTAELSVLGSVVGRLYALSTLGSFIGTLAAGFLLLPNFGSVPILVMCSVVLILIATSYFFFFARAALPAAGAAIVIGVAALTIRADRAYSTGTLGGLNRDVRWRTVYQVNGFYGRIRVVDTTWASSERRYLLNDGLLQGYIEKDSGIPAGSFPYALADLVLAPDRTVKRALVLGLGAGFVPRLLLEHGVEKVVTVEINPAMLEVATSHFGFPRETGPESRCQVAIEDARTWVKRCADQYDAIVFDTFLGDNAPAHLLSYEMFCDLRRILAPGGTMSMNIFGSMRDDGSRLIAALVRTLAEGPDGIGPFPHVQIFSKEATAVAHNVYILAAPEPRPARPGGVLKVFPRDTLWYREVQEALRDQTAQLAGLNKAPILLDDQNPAEHLDVTVRVRLREEIRKNWGDAIIE